MEAFACTADAPSEAMLPTFLSRPLTVRADPDEFPSVPWYSSRPVELPRPKLWRGVLLLRVEGDGCCLRQPIAISISWEQGYFIADYEPLSQFGEGTTVGEAVGDLFHSLCVVFSAYRDTPDEMLDDSVSELLAKYDQILQWTG